MSTDGSVTRENPVVVWIGGLEIRERCNMMLYAKTPYLPLARLVPRDSMSRSDLGGPVKAVNDTQTQAASKKSRSDMRRRSGDY